MRVRQLSGSIDASFAPFNSDFKNYQSSYVTANENVVIAGIYSNSQIFTGMNLAKYGRSSGSTNGRINSTSATATYLGKIITDQVYVSNQIKPGDSGGPVGALFSGPLPSGQDYRPFQLVGINVATSSSNSYATKATNICSQFGLSPVAGY